MLLENELPSPPLAERLELLLDWNRQARSAMDAVVTNIR